MAYGTADIFGQARLMVGITLKFEVELDYTPGPYIFLR